MPPSTVHIAEPPRRLTKGLLNGVQAAFQKHAVHWTILFEPALDQLRVTSGDGQVVPELMGEQSELSLIVRREESAHRATSVDLPGWAAANACTLSAMLLNLF